MQRQSLKCDRVVSRLDSQFGGPGSESQALTEFAEFVLISLCCPRLQILGRTLVNNQLVASCWLTGFQSC